MVNLRPLRPWMIVTVAGLLYALGVVLSGGTEALVTLGTRFADGDPHADAGTEGYDGQFVYFIARDPSDAARFLDIPAYRFQRILLPALARLLALGAPSLIPWTILLVNLAALAAGTALLERLLAGRGASPWFALGYGLSLGVLGAARLSLPEPLAYALALAGIAAALRERVLAAAVLFALAALAKETTLVLAAPVGLWLLAQGRWRQGLLFGVVTLAPFLVWQAVLLAHLGALGAGSGGALATSFELAPFLGVARILTEGGVAVFAVLGAILAPFVLLPAVWGLVRAGSALLRGDRSLFVWLLLFASGIMPFVPFSTYREPLGILRFIVGLQIALILYAAHRRHRRALMYSTLWALTLLFVVLSDFSGAGF